MIFDIDMGVLKKCSTCGEQKPLSEYNKRSGRLKYKLYLQHECKQCQRDRFNKYWAEKKTDKQYKEKRQKAVKQAVNKFNQTEKGKEYRIKALQKSKELIESKPKSSRIYVKVCEETGKLFVARYKNAKRSTEGNKIYWSKWNENKYWRYNDSHKTCTICGKHYDYLVQGSISYCSDKCKRIAIKMYRNNAKIVRKIRMRSNVYETVNPFKVFKRDGWKCMLCGCATPRKLRGTIAPNAPELDHIIPLSKGGSHTYSNTQCLCRTCNQNKSDKFIGQQKLCI